MDAITHIAEFAHVADFIERNYRFRWRINALEGSHSTNDCVLSMDVISTCGRIEMFRMRVGTRRFDVPWTARIGMVHPFDTPKIRCVALKRASESVHFRVMRSDARELVTREIASFLSAELDVTADVPADVAADNFKHRNLVELAQLMRADATSKGVIERTVSIPRKYSMEIYPSDVVWNRQIVSGMNRVAFDISRRDVFGLLPLAHAIFGVRVDPIDRLEHYLHFSHVNLDGVYVNCPDVVISPGEDISNGASNDISNDTFGNLFEGIASPTIPVQIRAVISANPCSKNSVDTDTVMISALGHAYIPTAPHDIMYLVHLQGL